MDEQSQHGWLHVVGVGEQGVQELPAATRRLLENAQTIFGSPRFLDRIAAREGQDLRPYLSPFSRNLEAIIACRNSPTVVLASGDPNWFGIGATLSRHVGPDEMRLHPALSSFQLAAALLHWPLEQVRCLSLHGRPVENLARFLAPGARILALTGSARTLGQVRDLLLAANLPETRLSILENLGGEQQVIHEMVAADPLPAIGDFYVLAIHCPDRLQADYLARVPGLSDHLFRHDGQLTKRQVRAATLAHLAPFPGALLWDLGAGSGSIGIEWMRAAAGARATCVEINSERCANIRHNAGALGVPALEVVCADSAQWLASRDVSTLPDAIFLGASLTDEPLFETCLKALRPGGRLVANAVTVAAQQALLARQARLGGELSSLSVASLGSIGSHRAMKPALPVLQWCLTKSQGGEET
ncbi:MAG TPA: precorrin-6y C5,15-methyltransferase (decarboxylating) subunit CbiE [Devosia sp.]|nr:precorrin-6y C5,15-methyltransferase (decarboxylating) subunit CbiE [Devosia sp.]